MAQPPLHSVQVLTLREIAEMWAQEEELKGVPISAILRELQIAVLNMPQFLNDEPLLSPNDYPPDNKLPDPDERVDRAWLIRFCKKQGWNKPRFWFLADSADGESEKFPGRPGYPFKPALKRELDRRAKSGEMHNTLASEMKQLREWAVSEYPDHTAPTVQTLENAFRHLYRELKLKHPPQN